MIKMFINGFVFCLGAVFALFVLELISKHPVSAAILAIPAVYIALRFWWDRKPDSLNVTSLESSQEKSK